MPQRLFRLSRLPAAIALLAFASGAVAQTLTFEGTTTTGANRELDLDIANAHGPSLIDYAGYDWLGMMVAKPLVSVGNPQQITVVGSEYDEDKEKFVDVYTTKAVDAGFHRSLVSGDTVAFTKSFSGSTELYASITARPNSTNFNFVSSYLTSGWRDDINVMVTGKRGGSTVYSQTLTVGDDAPMLYSFNFMNIDKVEFLTSGGTFLYPNGNTIGSYVNPSFAFSTPVLVFDNVTLAPIPEPETYALMLAGLGLVGFAARRRKQEMTA